MKYYGLGISNTGKYIREWLQQKFVDYPQVIYKLDTEDIERIVNYTISKLEREKNESKT